MPASNTIGEVAFQPRQVEVAVQMTCPQAQRHRGARNGVRGRREKLILRTPQMLLARLPAQAPDAAMACDAQPVGNSAEHANRGRYRTVSDYDARDSP
jgi:hypothetical protein